jgi:hypothetical protein
MGSWQEEHFTGKVFARVFCLRYLGSSKPFPPLAAERLRNLKRAHHKMALTDIKMAALFSLSPA